MRMTVPDEPGKSAGARSARQAGGKVGKFRGQVNNRNSCFLRQISL